MDDDPRLIFELRCRPSGVKPARRYDPTLNTLNVKFAPIGGRLERLGKEPAWFKPMRGYHRDVAKEADRLNRSQLHSGFLDYWFFPEVAETVSV